MKRRVAQAVSALLAAELAILATGLPAMAGDAASFAPLGFSSDGRYFAYEEFGVQDGSGFPFSNLFILDVEADKWVGGSPFRVRIDEEAASGHAPVRRQSAALAARALATYAIEEPAVAVALNGDGEPVEHRSELAFGRPGYGMSPPQDVATLRLSEFASTSSVPCVESYGFEPPVGFALEMQGRDATTELHRDQSVPASRGCTVGYALYGVFAPVGWPAGELTPVGVISVYSHGFEGPDRRFLALPLKGMQ